MLQPKIISVKPLKNYKISLEYETGAKKVFDVKPYIDGDWYEELADVAYFQTVKVVRSGSGIEWANGQDIAPHELYEQSIKVDE